MADVTTVTGIGDPSFNYFRDRVYNNPGLGCHRLNDSKDAGRRRGERRNAGKRRKMVGGDDDSTEGTTSSASKWNPCRKLYKVLSFH